nr:hypothetical protein [Tanacetum cinerariifolium]
MVLISCTIHPCKNPIVSMVVPKNYDPERKKIFNSFALSYSSARLCVFIPRATMRSSSRLASDQSSNPTSSMNTNPKSRNRKRCKQRIENSNLEEQSHIIVMMTDNRTMAELLRAHTEGHAEAIVVPLILAE